MRKSSSWRTIKIKELSAGNRPAVKAGPFGSALKKECFVPSGYKVYGQEQVIRGNAQYGDYYISEDKYNKLKSCSVLPGDVLVSLVGTAGRVLVIHEDDAKGVINPRLLRLSLDTNQILPEYLKLFFEDTKTTRLLKRWSQGGTMDVLNTGMVENLKIHYPPLPDQNAIVDLFSTWDEAIKKIEKLIEVKEKRFKWLLNELIGKPASEGQEGWRKVKLGEICIPITRKNSIGETNVLTSSARHGLISQLHYYKKSVSGADLSKYYLLRNGDFAYNRSSANGYPFGAIKRLEKCNQGVLSTLYLCFSIVSENECLSDYLLAVFEASVLNRGLRAVCQEGARSHGLLNITKSDFFDLGFYLPIIENQKLIAGVLTTAKEEIDLLKKIAERYRDQKQGLMQKLLTGQWRVKLEGA